MKKIVVIMGDTHCLNFLHRLPLDFENFVLIGVGDHGELEEKHTALHDIMLLQKYCDEHNGAMFFVRGNHSNPAWFDYAHWANSCDKVKFVPDNTVLEIEGKKVLFSGGATSVDRLTSTLGIDYWTTEKFQPDFREYGLIDILITHGYRSADMSFARIQHYIDNDPSLKQELLEETALQLKFHDHVKPALAHFYGHYHFPNLILDQGCRIQCLDMDEMYDATRLFT